MQMQKMYKKLHKMQLTREKRGVRDKKKGPFKMVEKVSPLPSELVTGFFSRHKMQEILPGKNRKMQKMQHSRGNALQKKTQKKNLTAKNKMSQNANNNNDNNAFAYLALKNTTTEAPPTRIFFREGLRIEQRRITIKMELTKQTKG